VWTLQLPLVQLGKCKPGVVLVITIIVMHSQPTHLKRLATGSNPVLLGEGLNDLWWWGGGDGGAEDDKQTRTRSRHWVVRKADQMAFVWVLSSELKMPQAPHLPHTAAALCISIQACLECNR
jgi:hypothetical protein